MGETLRQIDAWIKDGKSVHAATSLRGSVSLIGHAVSWFANSREKSGESWRVVLLSPHYEWTVETFREILNSVPLPGDTVQRSAIYAKHGFIHCVYDDFNSALYGTQAKHVLWVMESQKEETWDVATSRLEPGHMILAFGWIPERYWSLFSND